MTWFLPERELHLHKLSWHPRENSKEEISPGLGSSTPRPSHHSSEPQRRARWDCQANQSVPRPHSTWGTGTQGLPGPRSSHLVSTPVTPVMQGTLGGPRGGWWHWRTPEPEPPVLLPSPRTSRPRTHSYLCLLTNRPGAEGPEDCLEALHVQPKPCSRAVPTGNGHQC